RRLERLRLGVARAARAAARPAHRRAARDALEAHLDADARHRLALRLVGLRVVALVHAHAALEAHRLVDGDAHTRVRLRDGSLVGPRMAGRFRVALEAHALLPLLEHAGR